MSTIIRTSLLVLLGAVIGSFLGPWLVLVVPLLAALVLIVNKRDWLMTVMAPISNPILAGVFLGVFVAMITQGPHQLS
jgi:hypothetical protein